MRLVTALPRQCAPGETLILCPFLTGLDPEVAMWLGPLAWHDCNGALLRTLDAPAPEGATVFAGVFCADPFRVPEEIIALLRRVGVGAVVNLPSVTFLDGEVSQTLRAMRLGKERELEFLLFASRQGFDIAVCTCELGDAQAMVAAGAKFVITHAGPPLPERAARRERLEQKLAQVGVPTLPLTSLARRCAF